MNRTVKKYVGQVKRACDLYCTNAETTIRKLVTAWDGATADAKGGKITYSELGLIKDEVDRYDIEPVHALRLIADGDIPRSKIKWLADNITKVGTLYALSGKKLRSAVRKILEDYLAGSQADLKKLAKCKTGCDIARYGLPYPLLNLGGVAFKKIDDPLSFAEMGSIYRMVSSDAIIMRTNKGTGQYGDGLVTIPERVEFIGRDSSPAKPCLVSMISKTGQKSIMDIGTLLDVLAAESII